MVFQIQLCTTFQTEVRPGISGKAKNVDTFQKEESYSIFLKGEIYVLEVKLEVREGTLCCLVAVESEIVRSRIRSELFRSRWQ